MKKLSRILSIAIALCMVLSLGCVSFAADDTSAYHEYLHEWLLAELEVNSSMTLEQVEDEFMPLINADDYVSFPAEMLFNGMLNNGCPMTYEEWSAANGGAAAAPAASGEASAEPAAEGGYPETANHADVADMEPAEYAYLTNYTNRDDSGHVFIGYDVVGTNANIELDDTVTGEGYTSVYAHDGASAEVTGTLVATDEGSGEFASDFSGQGALFVAMNESTIDIHDAEIYTDGFERSAGIVATKSTINFRNSYVESLGADPLTEAYDSYVNSANQNIMLSPPWVLGIQGGSRVVNMIGEVPTLNILNTTFVSGGWALISTDAGSNMVINVVDSELDMLPESEGGMDSGWRIFGYDEDAYGSGYGSYYIGNPSQYYYGATFNGVTYAAIITGATVGHYASSNGDIDIYDAQGNLLETVEGKGQPTVINGVFGFMQHNSLTDGIYVEDGTIVNTADAIVIYKAANGDYYFDNAELNSENGVLFQMIDNDDDSRVGMISMAEGFSTEYDEEKVSGEIGFPGITYDYESKAGGNTVSATYTNGDYEGNIYNGTGYYGQAGDDLFVTVGEGATLTGDIALTSTIKGVPYSPEAVEGIAYYGDDIGYVFLDAEGNECDEADAAFIQIRSYTINEYFLQGHVQNLPYYNGTSTLDVTVKAGAEWKVTGTSLITSLTVEDGAKVYGELVKNADGSLTLTASDETLAAGTYGTIEAIGGGQNVGGGVTDDGTLDVEAAAGAIAVGGSTAASGEPSGEASAEPASEAVTAAVADMEPSEYEYLTNYANRKTPGMIYVGNDETGEADIALNDTVTGEGYTAVYAHGEDADVTVSGTLTILDESEGENTSDFSGQGSATVAYDDANLTLKDLTYYSTGFERGVAVVSENSLVTIEDSDITVMGNDPLTNAWEGYHSSADQNYMISPPWPLGITGGGRILNMIGTTPKLTILNSTLVGGQTWGLLSTDSGSNMTINVVDSELTTLPESEGGSDSGWRIFGYDEDAYGSSYGSYYIGNPSQYYYGTTFNGVTYAAIITGAEKGVYASSNGTIDMVDASGEPMGSVEGKGQPTVINGVFGFMQHNSIGDGIYVIDGTVVNSADAIVIYKAANGNYVFDEAELNSGNGVLFQMIDNDDDSRIGGMPMSVDPGFDEVYSDTKIASYGEGFPGVNYDAATKSGGNTVTISYANGEYNGNIYNGTGYYGQSGDNLVVTLGENAVLNGDVALTSTIKGVPYSPEAIEGIEYYGDDIKYILLDAEGNVTTDESKAAFIQITEYTIRQYFLQGHVENLIHFNGVSTAEVVVEDGAVWNVAGESLITSLTIEDGAVVKGTLVENADGSLTLTAGDDIIAAGAYGGNVEAIGGGINVGGGVDANGELNVGAAAAAIADPAASGEPSGEASAEPAEETVTIGEYTFTVYTFDGVQYVKLADLAEVLDTAEEEPAASGEPSGEPSAEPAAQGGDTSEEAYKEYLKSYVAACPAVSDEQYEEFAAAIDAGAYDSFPVDMCFTDTYWGYVAATYDEFVAAGGNVALPAFDAGLTADATV